ncbi:MAG: response regulator [Bacteroidetes bacterium]|nr:response regulator [Bacteroidota bacterium]
MQQRKRILLIDDDYDNLLACNLILQRRGFNVLTLPGCEKMDDLTDVLQTFQPQLIFMEHDMRGICGPDLTKMLKSNSEFKHIPIIYFSGRDDIASLAEQTKADGYLNKPLKVDTLMGITYKYLPRD